MKKVWFSYLTGLFILFLWNVFLYSAFSAWFLIVGIVLMPVDFICVRAGKREIGLHLFVPLMKERGQEAEGSMQFINPGVFSCHVGGELQSEKRMTGEKNCLWIETSLSGKEKKSVPFTVESEEPGGVFFYQFRLKKYGPFGLFYKWESKKLQEVLFFMPHLYDTVLPEWLSLSKKEDTESFRYRQNGYDFSEPSGYREYIPGDDMRAIHWKLSLRYETIFVKEGNIPVYDPPVFRVETALVPVEESFAAACGSLVEYVASLFTLLCEQHLAFTCIWYDYRQNRIWERKVKNREDIQSLLFEIMQSGFKNGLPEKEWYEENDRECVISYDMQERKKEASSI